MPQRILSILARLSRASLITAVSSACALLELWALGSRLPVHELGVVLAAQGAAALLAAVGEAGLSLWAAQRLATCATPRRLTALSRYAIAVRLPLFAVQALLIALAARYTLVGWSHFGVTLLMSASMAFSFGWIFIATEHYLPLAATEGVARVTGLAAFLVIPVKSADTALLCLALSGAAQSLLQLFVARRTGLLTAMPALRFRRVRIHVRHVAAYRSAVILAVGRNILPVSVGAIVAAPIASTALAAEKVSRAATGVVSAVLGYILPALGRGFRERRAVHVVGINLFAAAVVASATAAALAVYIHVSHAPLAALFSGDIALLATAAILTGTRVAFSATLYTRVLARGDFVLASRLLAAQTVSAGFAAILLQAFSSVVLLLVVLSLFDLALVALAVQFGQRIQEKR